MVQVPCEARPASQAFSQPQPSAVPFGSKTFCQPRGPPTAKAQIKVLHIGSAVVCMGLNARMAWEFWALGSALRVCCKLRLPTTCQANPRTRPASGMQSLRHLRDAVHLADAPAEVCHSAWSHQLS